MQTKFKHLATIAIALNLAMATNISNAQDESNSHNTSANPTAGPDLKAVGGFLGNVWDRAREAGRTATEKTGEALSKGGAALQQASKNRDSSSTREEQTTIPPINAQRVNGQNSQPASTEERTQRNNPLSQITNVGNSEAGQELRRNTEELTKNLGALRTGALGMLERLRLAAEEKERENKAATASTPKP